jgi:hypothetical protein
MLSDSAVYSWRFQQILFQAKKTFKLQHAMPMRYTESIKADLKKGGGETENHWGSEHILA